jgi:hypothetical protein
LILCNRSLRSLFSLFGVKSFLRVQSIVSRHQTRVIMCCCLLREAFLEDINKIEKKM